MFEQDYVMRIIQSLVKFLAKTFLDKDAILYELPSEKNYTQTDYLHKQLLSLITQGKINEAENLLFEKLDSKNKRYMELALDFYQRLNDLDDEFLEEHNFPRDEIEQGLKDIVKEFGISI
jgi:uncharacterized protein DUF6483